MAGEGGVVPDLDYSVKWNFIEYTKDARTPYAKNRQLRAFLKGIFNLNGSERILDVGCGIGTLGKLISPFLSEGGEICGIDLDPQLVAYGNKHWARRPNIHLEVGDANQIAYPDASFDVVASFGLLEHVSNRDRVLSEMRRVLKRPGKLIVLQIDVLNFVLKPSHEAFETFYRDLRKGMLIMGIDLQMADFRALCERANLPLEKFTFTMEYRATINEPYIHLFETGVKEFLRSEEKIREITEWNYQFLKEVGWTRDRTKEMIDRYMLPNAPLIAFFKAHLGEEYYRKIPIQIYRIHLLDE